MLFDAFSGWVAKWWWLITLVVVVVILLIPGKRSHRQKKKGRSSGTGPERRRVGSRSSGAQIRPAHRVDSHTIRARWVESPTRTITGKAYVTDGDGIRVARKDVRLAGLDAPEWDQKAKHQDGYWFNHGRRVKSALIQKIGGKHVSVAVESVDKFGRIVGTVTCEGRSVNGWCGKDLLSPPTMTATDNSSGGRVKRSAACGHTPTTSIPGLTDTVSGEGLSNVSSSRGVQCQQGGFKTDALPKLGY